MNTKTSTEHYTRLEPTETEHAHPDCGCTLRLQEHGGVALYQCPMHAAASDMLTALRHIEELSECYCYSTQPGEPCETCEIRAAIDKAEGRES